MDTEPAGKKATSEEALEVVVAMRDMSTLRTVLGQRWAGIPSWAPAKVAMRPMAATTSERMMMTRSRWGVW